MAEQVNTVPGTSHDHTKIITKLQNNKPEEPSEDLLTRTPITKDIKRGNIKASRTGGDSKGTALIPMDSD